MHAGARENDIAAELEYQMRALGAEKAAFDTIVTRRVARVRLCLMLNPQRIGSAKMNYY